MLKSHLSKTDNPSAVVTRQDVGSFVQVQGVGKGILRYVGPIHGKDGMFCGIELDNDGGKHNGTYMNVSYFSCPPKRGIFAPLYKVELDELDDVPMMTTSQQVSSHQRMIRSALPSLPLRISTTPRTDDIMQASIYSDISMNMDGSMLSTASWGDDLMMTSNFTNTTYNIPSNKSYFNDTEEFDLMSVQAPKSVIQIDREALRREEERLSGLGTSVVLENSRIGVENLPIVEDDEDDLETPLVEHVPQSDFFKPLHCSTLLETNESHDSFQDGNEAFVRPPSRQSVDTGYNGESDTSKLSSIHDDSNEDHNRNNKNVPAVVLKSKKSTSPSLHRKVSPLPKMEIKEEKPKKVKEVAPSAPKFPVKPKAPSKHQMMMEQLKASIEAEKNKPKKEIKPRVSLLPPPVKAKENEDPSTMAVNPPEAPKKAKPVISKISSIAPPSKPVIERPKKERQPLYVPPPPKEKKEKEVAKPSTAPSTVSSVSKPVDVAPPSTAPSESSAPSTKTIVKPKPQFPTSSFAGSNAKSAASPARTSKSKASEPTPGPSKPIPKKEIADSEKLARLQRAVQTSDALSIALNQREFKRAELEVKLVETLDRLAEKSKQVEELRSRLTVADQRYQEEVERSKAHGEQVTRAHSETVERLKTRHEQQLEEKSKEHERALDDEKSRHEAEVEAMSRRHQKVVAALDEKIAEAEKIAEQLKIDKKSLQTALSNDSDQRNQMLTKEINSLQTALEFKSSEMKELRQKHQQVALRVEEIPVKELEITKLKHKVTELKQALDQKMNYEKLLVHQNEELKRHQMAVEEEKDSMQRSMDVMRYKYENGETIDEETFTPSKFFTPSGKVQFRSRSSNSEHRPNSGIQVPTATNTSSRLSQSSYTGDIMDRSYDRDSLTRSSISMFTSQVRLPENHADDVIYAPDEIILTSSCKKRLSFAEEEDNEQVNGNSTNAQTDSGIGAI